VLKDNQRLKINIKEEVKSQGQKLADNLAKVRSAEVDKVATSVESLKS